MDRTSRIRFFAIALPLKALSDGKAMERLSETYSSYSDGRRATGLLLGYKLIMESIPIQTDRLDCDMPRNSAFASRR